MTTPGAAFGPQAVRVSTGLATYFDTEMHDPAEPATTFEERRGRCYELAGAAMVVGTAPPGSVLVHGTIDGHTGFGRLGHAWLWLPGGWVWEPVTGDLYDSREAWLAFADARVVRAYDLAEVRRMVDERETYGPWHEHDYR